jgi:hypothetical protein
MIKNLKTRIILGGKSEIRDLAVFFMKSIGFYGGDWNPNNKIKIELPLMERFFIELVRADNPTLVFCTEKAWTYGIDQEEGEPSDVTAISWRTSPKTKKFSLPSPKDGESCDVLPWYESRTEAEEDAEGLNMVVSYFFGLDDKGHKARMKLLKKKPRGYIKKMKGLLPK